MEEETLQLVSKQLPDIRPQQIKAALGLMDEGNSAAAFSFVCAVNASSIFGYLIQTITIFANSRNVFPYPRLKQPCSLKNRVPALMKTR